MGPGVTSRELADLRGQVERLRVELAAMHRQQGPASMRFRLARVSATVPVAEYEPPVTGLAALVVWWDVIPLDVVDRDGRPEVSDRRLSSIRARAGGSQMLSVGDLVSMHQADDGTWWIVSVYATERKDRNCCGCSPTECLDFAWWELAENNCPKALLLTVDDDMACCSGDAAGSHVLQYNAGNQTSPASYIGPGVNCGTSGRDCGTTTFVWQTIENCGSVTYQYGAACGSVTYTYSCQTQQDQNGNSFTICGWVMSGTCAEGCYSNTPQGFGFPGQMVTVQCLRSGGSDWVQISGSCNCGTAPPPTEPGTQGQTVVVPCEYDGDPGRWVVITNDCECGDPVEPTEPGSTSGEIKTTSCVDPDAQPECGTATWQFYDCEGTTYTASETLPVGWTLVSSYCGSASPTCGAAGSPPSYPPTVMVSTVTVPCELDGWELIQDDCTCGSPVAPSSYAAHGDILTRPCESPIVAFWRLIPATGYDPAEVQFVVGDDVKIRYRLPLHRSWCCKCQSRWDIVVDDPCRWPCTGIPQSVCVRPIKTGPSSTATCGDLAKQYALVVEEFNELPSASGNIDITGANDIGGVNGNWTMSLYSNDTGGCGQWDAPCGGEGAGCCTYLEASGARWIAQTCDHDCVDLDDQDCSFVSVRTRYTNCGSTSLRLHLAYPMPGILNAFAAECSPGFVEWCRKRVQSSGTSGSGCVTYDDIRVTYDQIEVLDDGSLVMQRGATSADCPEYLLLVPIP